MHLYRYLQPPFGDELVNQGKLRLGTIEKYKDLMAHDQARGDSKEGQIEVYNSDLIIDSENMDPKLKKFIEPAIHLENCWYSQISTTQIFSVENCIALCLTKSPMNDRHLREFGSDCIEILDIHSFVQVITETLIKDFPELKIEDNAAHPVIYCDKRFHYTEQPEGTSPVWFKDKGFVWQEEFRCLWAVNQSGKLKEHYDIQNAALSSLVRKI